VKRHNLILTVVLVVQVGLSVFLLWPRTTAGTEGEPVFADLEPGDIVALTIQESEGKLVRLRREAGEWVLPDAGGYPASAERVTQVLDALASLSTDQLVARTEPSHRSLQVADDDFLRRILIESSDGKTSIVYLGSSPRYGASHFRVFGQDEVYLTSELQSWDVGASASSWIDTAYVSVPREDIVKVTLANPKGTLVFKKESPSGEGAASWAVEGLAPDEEIDNASVNSLVYQVASVAMQEPLGTEERESYGLDTPTATVTIETADDTIILQVGATDAQDAAYVVKASSSPYYVRVQKWNLNYVVEYGRADFLKPPPTPEAEEAVEPSSAE
jgi:hypothetical protein